MMLLGWGSSSTGDSSGALTGLLHSIDAARGYGAYNFGAYASAEVDRRIEEATSTMDAKARLALMQGRCGRPSRTARSCPCTRR